MARTTKAQVDHQLEELTKLSGLPLRLEITRPGDGATRYRVMSAGTDLGRVCLGKTEIYDALKLANDVLWAMRRGEEVAW